MDIGTAKDAVNDLENRSDEEDDDVEGEDEDIDLIRAKEAQVDFPVCFTNMNDIKNKFESGQLQSKEEKREERKQEIQNIRSRLFMGKQARIKEMYQQAVAESEQSKRMEKSNGERKEKMKMYFSSFFAGVLAATKKPDVDIGDKAKSIKNKFETGELFKDDVGHHHAEDESVFEHGN